MSDEVVSASADDSKSVLKDDKNSSKAVRPKITVRQDWYQTDALVVVSLLTKNLQPADSVEVSIKENSVDFKAESANGDTDECRLHLDLANTVVPMRSTWKRFPSKVEIKLSKALATVWNKLERPCVDAVSSSSPAKDSSEPTYPSSSIHRRDWDKIAADIGRLEADEKVDGEAGVNKLFQELYEGGSDEVRRAMNKSFMESGGTVLSTNWKDVGKEKVQIKPPDGVEFKKWDS